MAHSYSQLFIHLVWSTKNREPFITSEIKPRLYGYIRKVLEDKKCSLFTINGMPDHVHILLNLPSTIGLSELLRHLKTTSSKWMHQTFPESKNFSWQDGYGAFSVGISQLKQVSSYIENQEKHHQKRNFDEEFVYFLKCQNISFDSRFVLG